MTKSLNILIVDDEPDILEVLSYNFEKRGFDVSIALGGKMGIKKAKLLHPDIIILDIMMPDISGLEVCKKLRKDSKLNDSLICILSAKNEENIEQKSLDIGADDFIAKPIQPKVLLNRILQLYQEKLNAGDQKALHEVGPFSIFKDQRKIFKDKKEIHLNKTEFSLFSILSSKPGRVYSRDELMIVLWDFNSLENAKELETTIKKLKKKIGKKYIRTLKKIGYKFEF